MNLQGTALTDLLNMLGFNVSTNDTKMLLIGACIVVSLMILVQEKNIRDRNK